MSDNTPYVPFHERTLSGEQKRKLVDIINEGIQITRECEDLKTSLNDTITSVAKELDVKASVLKKAINVARKGKFTETEEDFLTLEHVLQITGKDSL